MGFLKANNLAALVLDCGFATKKGSESHGFLEGEMVFRPRVIPMVAITRTEIWFERSAVSRRSTVDKKSEICLPCAVPVEANDACSRGGERLEKYGRFSLVQAKRCFGRNDGTARTVKAPKSPRVR